jgi:hypothetical protein
MVGEIEQAKKDQRNLEPRNPMGGRLAPPAGMIEEAADGMNDLTFSIQHDQASELRFAEGSLQKLGIKIPISEEVVKAYMLGLQVARVALAQEPKAAENDINI